MLLALMQGAWAWHPLAAADDPDEVEVPYKSEQRSEAVQFARDFGVSSLPDFDPPAARTACAAGVMSACSALGIAYRAGGRDVPRIRPFAEVLLRRACYAAEAEACAVLSGLVAVHKDPAVRAEAPMLRQRACRLGLPEPCEGYPAASAATLAARQRAACAAGGMPACRAIARDLVQQKDRPQRVREGLAMFDRQCRAGDGDSCQMAAFVVSGDGRLSKSTRADYFRLGCDAGKADACRSLADIVFPQVPGGPAAAIALYEQGCRTDKTLCDTAGQLRAAPDLEARCAEGEAAGCAALGELLHKTIGPLRDVARGRALLAAACEGGHAAACRKAGEYVLNDGSGSEPEAGPDRGVALLSRGCEAGDRASCEYLADGLFYGGRIPMDQERAAQLYIPQCYDGRELACDALRKIGDPAAPLKLAEDRDPPFMTAEEKAAASEARMPRAASRGKPLTFRPCTTSRVEWEGVVYAETVCQIVLGAIGGFTVSRGDEVAWQALIWRPAMLGTLAVPKSQRVLCGGSVVATGWVLTAAHCLIDKPDEATRFDIRQAGHRIRLGVLNQSDEKEGDSYPILDVIPIQQFDEAGLMFDIALVRYDVRNGRRGKRAYTPEFIAVDRLSLRERPVIARAPVFSFGWGRTDFKVADSPAMLQGVRLELRSARDCAAITRTDKPGLRDSMFCAAGPANQQTCNGDSGGPLVTYGDGGGVPTLIGIVSGGWNCGTTPEKWPSKYTRIGHPVVQEFLRRYLPGFASGQQAR